MPVDTQLRPVAQQYPSLVDGFLASWVSWREACEDVGSAFESWAECEPPQRGLAFVSYRAALDREEQAAHIHSDWTARLRASAR